jgi:hypothetical protein
MNQQQTLPQRIDQSNESAQATDQSKQQNNRGNQITEAIEAT